MGRITQTAIASSVLLLAIIVCGGVYLSAPSKRPPQSTPGPIVESPRQPLQTADWRHLVTLLSPSQSLVWSAMSGLAKDMKTAGSGKKTDSVVKISRFSVPRPLNLSLPDADIYANATNAAPVDPNTDPDDADKSVDDEDVLAHVDSSDVGLDEQKLFNQYNGLRGFMVQNWLSDNVGLKGGLAIPTNRMRDGEKDFRDQMAVGMGVLFAF